MASTLAPEPLQLLHVIGFGGKVPNGLNWHPDGSHVVFPLGSTLVLRDIASNRQVFLQGHTDRVTCIALSKCGRYIASGQRSEGLTKAPVYLWDFETALALPSTEESEKALLHKLVLHKGAIQSVEFSHDSSFLASLGGPDDNAVAVWEVGTGRAVCGTPAGSHAALAVKFFNNRADKLVTCGQFHVRCWDLNLERRRLTPDDWKTGSVKRVYTALVVDETDSRVFCGTSSGDILEFNTTTGNFLQASKVRFSLGVASMAYLAGTAGDSHLLVGTGDGAFARLGAKDLDVKKAAELLGSVTSVSPAPDGSVVLAGTDQGNLYSVAVGTCEARLLSTAHSTPIADVVFPQGTSELFITAAASDIRVWNTRKCAEVLRIQVPNLNCLCVAINTAGTSIISGWDDGKIRAFLPESGKLLYAIPDAHTDAVTALAFTHDGKRIVSGGRDGRIRVWGLSERSQKMELSFKEHKKEVTSIIVSHNDEEAVSASADGSCLIWNLKRGTRTNALFASTIFRSVAYHPDESQLLTGGSDRKLTYWDATDCSAIRVMDASTEEITSVDIQQSGEMLVSCGADRLVKVWLYDEGDCIAQGVGHSGVVTKAKIAPDDRIIVSGGDEGAIFIWKMVGAPEADSPSMASTGMFAATTAASTKPAAVTSKVAANALRTVGGSGARR